MDDLPRLPLRFLPSKSRDRSSEDEEEIIRSINKTMLKSLASFDLSKLEDDLSIAEGRREKAYAQSRLIERKIRALRAFLIRSGTAAEVDEAVSNLSALVAETIIGLDSNVSNSARINAPREGNLGIILQDVVQVHAYYHFLKTGMLIQQSECTCKSPDSNIVISFRDEEYISGVIAFTHDLARYGVGRGILKDTESIEIARDVVVQLMRCLLKYDFRNSPLRRRYDGMKFALKRLETILYELTGKVSSSISLTGRASMERNEKRSKSVDSRNSSINDEDENAVERVNKAEIEQIRNRMEIRDDMREKVIKRCRDMQRSARQAIYSLHRKDGRRVDKFISQCEECAEELVPIVNKEPGLRFGSFAESLEDYAEAKLFNIWHREKRLGTPNDIKILNSEEYLSALCNLTGEIGKYAVARGTQRESDKVKLCLATNQQILVTVQAIVDLPDAVSKKIDSMKESVEKMEKLLYDISMVQAGKLIPGEIRY